jgi:Predicted RNA-binding protein (contains KH domain)
MEERSKMSKYFETVDFWVENLLDSTESYTIESNEKGKFVDITINVAKDDMGKVIGKNGRIITALRVLMSSVAKKDRKSVKIEVKEM